MKRLLHRLSGIIPAVTLIFAAACNILTPESTAPPGTASPSAAVETQSVAEASPSPLETQPSIDPSQLTLRVWVPPQFDPYNGTPAGELMRLRMADFAALYPGMRIDVRVKAVEGPGGLLDSLTSASAAAPDAAPDLIALSRTSMEAAALKGLIHPYNGLSPLLESGGWFDYARQLALLQDSLFGIPFAGDSLVLLYDRTSVEPPVRLDSLLQSSTIIALPAADPQAVLTLDLYLASGGVVQDDQGRPVLDPILLEQVLAFYRSAYTINALLPQTDTPEQTLSAFRDGRVAEAAVWASSAFLIVGQTGEKASLAPLPSLDGTSYSLATGWTWALSTSQPERQKYSVELAEFLTEPAFLSQWTKAAGYLPVQEASLNAWRGSVELPAVEAVARSAGLIPSGNVLAVLSPVLLQAVLDVFSGQLDPQQAAEKAAAAVQ